MLRSDYPMSLFTQGHRDRLGPMAASNRGVNFWTQR